MMKYSSALVPIWVAISFAQSGVAPPLVGYIRDAERDLRPVLGVSGNFVLGDSVAHQVVSSAFSGSSGILKTESELKVFDRSGRITIGYPAPGGSAVFAFAGDGSPALIYFTETKTLFQLRDGRLESVPLDANRVAGEVLSIAIESEAGAVLTVRRGAALWRLETNRYSGHILSERLSVIINGPVLSRQDGTILFFDEQGLVIRNSDQSETRFPMLTAGLGFEEIGEDWVDLRNAAGTAHASIQLRTGRLYQLPAASPPAEEVSP